MLASKKGRHGYLRPPKHAYWHTLFLFLFTSTQVKTVEGGLVRNEASLHVEQKQDCTGKGTGSAESGYKTFRAKVPLTQAAATTTCVESAQAKDMHDLAKWLTRGILQDVLMCRKDGACQAAVRAPFETGSLPHKYARPLVATVRLAQWNSGSWRRRKQHE